MTIINHGTSFYRAFQIWCCGALEPRPVGDRHGYSTAMDGESVLFAFPEGRHYTGADVLFFFEAPEETRKGVFSSLHMEDDGEYQEETEPEYHVLVPVPVSICRIVVESPIPQLGSFQMGIDDEKFNAFEDENEKALSKFISWLKHQKTDAGLHH